LEDNIKTNLKELEWEGKDTINLAQDSSKWQALVKIVMYFWIP
jgi:hypothetical protein